MGLGKLDQGIAGFIRNYWVLKWFVLPIWVMATILLLLFLTVSRATSTETVQIVGLFVLFSITIVGVGIGVEYALYTLTGIELFQSREYDK